LAKNGPAAEPVRDLQGSVPETGGHCGRMVNPACQPIHASQSM